MPVRLLKLSLFSFYIAHLQRAGEIKSTCGRVGQQMAEVQTSLQKQLSSNSLDRLTSGLAEMQQNLNKGSKFLLDVISDSPHQPAY